MSTQLQAPQFLVQRSADRYFADHGWLKTYHSFSFADYWDPRNVNWGALRVLNDDRVAPGKGFGKHPHRDMEIISYVLEGQLEHRDSMGNHGVVSPGGVQYMSAGTGVTHSEFNHSQSVGLHFLQMWVPPRHRGLTPLYGQQNFDRSDRLDRWLVIASGVDGIEAPVRLDRDATFAVSRLESATLTYRFAPGRFGFLFVAVGDVEASYDGSSEGRVPLAAGDAVRIAGIDALTVRGRAEIVLWDVPSDSD